MRVEDKSGGENGVHNGVEGAADEGGDGERNKTGGDEAILVSQFHLYVLNVSFAYRSKVQW